ncbi:YbdK family carboxylate-amine ligase [Microbacterium sp. NPDC058345]|uniref:carboxylate-amine ligase n=1 Tax=Microbacterium sp. NPDC058345 TaxID=3346455 RepID=UPI00365503E2
MPLTTRFGIEEEFVLVDAHALVPVSASELHSQVLGAFPGGGRLTSEFLTSQIESATAPLGTLAEAGEQLSGMRGMLADCAPGGGLIASTGAPYALAGAAQVMATPHYDEVAELFGRLSLEHVVNGLHVHVHVVGDEERVRAMRRVREWLPVLLALSVNSPFAQGRHSGFASWRSIMIRRLPASWCPPAFHDAEDYHDALNRLMGIGLLPSRSSVSWAVRLSERYETVEVRVADAQLRVQDTLLITALTRAIVCASDLPESVPQDGELDASMWLAARHGMRAHLFRPDGSTEPAWRAVERMLAGIRGVLDELGDAAYVDEQLARLRSEGTGADRQVRAHDAGGVPALAGLFRDW